VRFTGDFVRSRYTITTFSQHFVLPAEVVARSSAGKAKIWGLEASCGDPDHLRLTARSAT